MPRNKERSERTEELNFATAQVPADGNCFFHSLAYCMDIKFYRENAHNNVGRKIAAELRRHLITPDAWTRYVMSLDESVRPYTMSLRSARSPQVWADYDIIAFIANEYDVAFLIYREEKMTWTYTRRPRESGTCREDRVIIPMLYKNLKDKIDLEHGTYHFEPLLIRGRELASDDALDHVREMFDVVDECVGPKSWIIEQSAI